MGIKEVLEIFGDNYCSGSDFYGYSDGYGVGRGYGYGWGDGYGSGEENLDINGMEIIEK